MTEPKRFSERPTSPEGPTISPELLEPAPGRATMPHEPGGPGDDRLTPEVSPDPAAPPSMETKRNPQRLFAHLVVAIAGMVVAGVLVVSAQPILGAISACVVAGFFFLANR